MVNIIKDYISVGRKNRPGGVNPCRYITIHNTGNANKGADARSHANYVKSDTAAKAMVSWHYTVDDTVAYQHLPDGETAYHAGDGSGPGNSSSIGIEICMNSGGDLLRATDNAAELTAELCKEHDIPIAQVVQHNYWSGKNCPEKLRVGEPYSWGAFLEKVEEFTDDLFPFPMSSIEVDLFGNSIIVPGVFIDDTNYVSIRALLEAMGYEVSWSNGTVIVRLPATVVKVDLFGEGVIAIPGRMIGGTNYVAIRALMESIGAEVGWIPETQTVTLRTP